MANPDADFEFPPELLVQPLVPIGITGLDTLHNAIHRTIWEALNNSRRQDRVPVLFKILSPSHEFIHPKNKRQPYELHIPKGILKRSWMHKHLTLVPAVVAIFYDLDWDDPHWEERKLECTSRVQSIRVALEGRGTKVCVVLIQQKTPLPSGEDLLASERANALIQSADLANKALFILPNVDNINGFTARLEKAFFDLGVNYYQHEIRNIKSHKEHLNKKTHQYLFVRHHFKLGFFSELKQDLPAAQVFYSDSYSNLLEVRLSDTNEFEVKTVAGFIAYKMCRVLFLLNKPRDAISQFRAHIEHYRHKTGHPQLMFHHYAWLSKQYSVFADLFAEMIHLHNIPAVQTQHPGFFYHLAAKHAISRKMVTAHLCPEDVKYPEKDPLEGKEKLEFYGQRPWRPCQLSAEPLDPDRERHGVDALQFIERNRVNHSSLIIGLLGNAITQFKTYRCPRMRRQLVVKMADEYYAAQDYGKALTLLTHVLWDYRVEKWLLIFDKLLVTALSCAYLTASLPDYVGLSIEAIARLPDASRVLENLITVTQGGAPKPEPSVSKEVEIKKADEAWADTKPDSPVTVDMANVFSSIHCKAHITQAFYNSVVIQIYFRSELPATIEFSRISTCLSFSTCTTECLVDSQPPYTLEPFKIASFICQVEPQTHDVAKPVQILSVLARLGAGDGREVVLKFTGLSMDQTCPHPELLHFRCKKGDKEVDKLSRMETTVNREISRREPLGELVLDLPSPALLNEWFPISLRLTSHEASPLHHVSVLVTLCDPATEHNINICEKLGGELVSLPLSFKVDEVAAKGEMCNQFLVKSSSLGQRQFKIEVMYNIEKDQCLIEKVISFDVVNVFELTTKFMNKKFETLQNVYSRETFLLQTKITCVSSWPIKIHSTSYSLGDNVSFETEYRCSLSGSVLGKDEVGLCVASLLTLKPSDKPLSLATLHITWSRLSKDGLEMSENKFKLDCWSSVEDTPVTVVMEPPVCGQEEPTLDCASQHHRMRVPFSLVYCLTNHTSLLLTFQLRMEASDSFMFSGHKQVVINLLPESTRKLRYKLCPLITGLVALPKLTLLPLTPAISQAHISHILERMLPTSLYILPLKRKVEQEDPAIPTITV